MSMTLTVGGKVCTVRATPGKRLSEVLRDDLGLKSVKGWRVPTMEFLFDYEQQ